jgi:hypothetical protein
MGLGSQAVEQAGRISEPPSARQYPGERHEPFTDEEMAAQTGHWTNVPKYDPSSTTQSLPLIPRGERTRRFTEAEMANQAPLIKNPEGVAS